MSINTEELAFEVACGGLIWIMPRKGRIREDGHINAL
jgi:hypothetical protein